MNPQDKPDLHDMRVSYELGELVEDLAHESPVDLFHTWLADAIAQKLPEPNAMSLATDRCGWSTQRANRSAEAVG